MISRAKQQYYEHKLAATDQKTCFKVVSELLDTAGTTLPDSTNNQHLCDDFAKFFSDKNYFDPREHTTASARC